MLGLTLGAAVVVRRPTTTGRETSRRHVWWEALLLGLALLALFQLPDDPIYAVAAQVTDLASYPVTLAAAALIYVYFRLSPGQDAAWLAVAAVFGTAQGAGLAALRIVTEHDVGARPAWILLSHVVVAVVLCVLLAAAGKVRLSVDPVVLGLSMAVSVTAARLILVERVDPSDSLVALSPQLGAALLVLYAIAALLLVRQVPLPTWAGRRLAAVVVMLGVAQVLTYPVPAGEGRSLLAVAFDIAGATMLAVTSLQLVLTVTSRATKAEQRVRELEEHVRDDRTLLHEVVGTMARISAATHLLSLQASIPGEGRRRLEELLRSETERVDRMIHGAADEDDPADVDLDALIDSVLFCHGIRGRVVAWHPTGDRVWARRDHLHEVLDILLDNAARHTRSPILSLNVSRSGDCVEMAVVDQGPGIPPELADSLLEWGSRGADSPGQGIGLNVAQRLVTDMGGHLRIESNGGGGTRVVVSLPAVGGRPSREAA